MNNEDINKIKNIEKRIRKINAKVKLLGLLNRAKKEYDENKLDSCEKTCLEVLQTNPNNFVALRGLGCVMQSRGDFKKALEYYKKALKTSENKEIEYTLIGTIYYLQDDYENAIKNYNSAIDINDDYEPAYEGKNQSMLENHLQILDLQDNLIQRNLF